jgi:hypothetical protein
MEQDPLPDMPDPTGLITLRQASDAYDIPYQTLHSAVSSGRIPRQTPPGTRILILPEHAESYAHVYRKFRSAPLRRELK